MFTVIAFAESLDPAGSFVNIAAVVDQHVKTSGDFITVPALNQLIAAYACAGATPGEARLVAPSLRRTNPYYIAPVEGAIVPSADPLMMYHPESPVPLDTNESLEAELNSNLGGAAQLAVAAWLSDGAPAPVTGQIFTVNCEITLALVVDTWAFSEISFPDNLPVGSYQVVGARAVIANGIVFRFVPVGASNRPGGVSANGAAGKDPFLQRYGRLGEWFTFDQIQPPGVEVLGSAATGSATYQLYVDLIAL